MHQRLDTADAAIVAARVAVPETLGAYGPVKRALDVSVSLVALMVCLPVFIFAALLIKLDTPGPVFYRQHRRGLGGELFSIWKFRTMVDFRPRTSDSAVTLPLDARITRLGKFLRDSKIDELPQLLNILAGDMSIIGPRPLSEQESCNIESLGFSSNHPGFIHSVRPGMIGLEQIMRRRFEGGLDYANRFQLNCEYAHKFSWRLDAYIFAVALIQCRLVCSLAAISAAAEMVLFCSM